MTVATITKMAFEQNGSNEIAADQAAIRLPATLDEFLAGVERRAFRMAELALSHREDAMDVVQDTMIIAHDRLAALAVLEPGARRSWTRNAMFFVARNTRRAELRRTAAWERLRDAFDHDAISEPGGSSAIVGQDGVRDDGRRRIAVALVNHGGNAVTDKNFNCRHKGRR